MFELLEKALLTGLGAVSMTQKKAEELLAEMREKYKLSEDEGKVLFDKIQAMAKDSRERINEMAENEVRKAIERIGMVPREEFDRLQKRVQALENMVTDEDQGPEC